MSKPSKARLGRGLDALLGSAPAAPDTEQRRVAVDRLQSGAYQPRRRFEPEALAELAESIKAQGVLQPILVRPLDGERYEIIAGERRWRAAQQAGLRDIPALVRPLDDRTTLGAALIENLQRADLNPIEQAQGFERLRQEFDLTHEEIGQWVGLSRAAVTNQLRLLALHPKVSKQVESGELDAGPARALLALPKERQPGIAEEAIRKQLNTRAVERLVRSATRSAGGGGKSGKSGGAEPDPDIAALERRLGDTLNTKVEVEVQTKTRAGKSSGGGRVVLHYYSLEQLDGILKKLGLDEG